MCSNDLRVADYTAELFLQGWAPLIIFSGGIAHQEDLQRIRDYPKSGFQIPQEIPEDVEQAVGELIDLGYNRHVL